MRSEARALVLIAGLLGVRAPTADAQDALITGVVRAEAGDSLLGSAEVLVDGRLVARSDAGGSFRLSAAPGSHLLEVRRIGFAPAAAQLEVVAGEALELVVRLATLATELDTVIVEAVAVSPTRKLIEFHLREERWPGGQFFEREEIMRRGVRQLSQFFRTVRGVDVKCIDKWCTGRTLVPSGARALPSLSGGSSCVIQYYLDGARIQLASDGVDGPGRPGEHRRDRGVCGIVSGSGGVFGSGRSLRRGGDLDEGRAVSASAKSRSIGDDAVDRCGRQRKIP